MKWQRGLLFLGVAVIAGLLAFPLREVVYQLIVIPLAYVLWLLNILYLSVPQTIWWLGIFIIALIFLVQSILPDLKPSNKLIPYEKHEYGQVESLARTLRKSDRGIYFKWTVANRLGKLAYQILLQREHGKPRSIFTPLTAEGWEATPEIQNYLEKGLHGSFAEFPQGGWGDFALPPKTPLDHNIKEVVEFLESKQGDSHF